MNVGVASPTPAVDAGYLTAGRVCNAKMRYWSPIRYENREDKARYAAEKYRAILGGSVLDVGADSQRLKALVAHPERYVGVDMNERADVKLNLDRDELPFPPRSFDTVVCTDVLEHLERIHAVFDALCRIADGHVLISLPNPLNNLLGDLPKRVEGWKKYYGLPIEPPMDRHRWFFGFEDAKRFLGERGRRNGFEIEQLDTEFEGCREWLDDAGEDVLRSEQCRKGTLWCVLKRTGSGAAA